MTKKLILRFLIFIIGVVIAFYSESFFREIIQDIFKWSTNNKIKFVGKNFFVFSNKSYFLIFGVVTLILSIENFKMKLISVFKNVIMSILIFWLFLISISAIDANLKVIECTACYKGIRKLHWNDINYGVIIGTSAFISIIPNLIRIIKKSRKHI